MKNVLKVKAVKIWLIITSVIVLLLTAATITARVPFIYGTINSVMGGERRVLKEGNPEEHIIYKADYNSKSETLAAARKLNEKIVEEGIVLLKNNENILPLTRGSKITVLGKNANNLILGGSGSSAGSGSGIDSVDLYTSLEDAGFEYNPVAKEFFQSRNSGGGRPAIPGMGTILTGYPIGEVAKDSYQNNTNLRNSYTEYDDVAIVVITRLGGEGYDLPRTMFYDGSRYNNWSGTDIIPGARSKDDHYLQLDQNETDLLTEASTHFDNVVIVINSSTPLELGFLDDPTHYAYHENILGAVWIGNPGETGINALGKVLNGEINPSGRTTDTYSRNFKNDPTWNNFGNNMSDGGNRYLQDGNNRNAFFVEYEEGIYIGYRYYETRGYTDGQAWYDEAVVYPLGYGLSYTTFSQEIIESSHANSDEIIKDDTITIKVKVTNSGNVSGKEVVQLYYTAPYYDNQIEKAHVVLGAFGKTSLLKPGESEIIELKIDARNMASYDYSDANGNGFKGYELDPGQYEIKLMKNANTIIDSIELNVGISGIKYTHDEITNTEINNLFDDMSNHIETYLSRKNWEDTWPTMVTEEERNMSQQFFDLLSYKIDDQQSDPWFSDTTPNQEKSETHYNRTKVKLYQLINKSYDDPLWDELLDQLTVAQMSALISKGNFRTININNIAKPLTIDADGPMGFAIFMGDPSVYDTGYYASEVVLGSTWNSELANELGVMIGNEGLIGDERGDGRPYSGWYAPAMNIHRSQFGGRNFEYYSEDGYLSGIMASEVVKGAKSKGVYTYVKHFALNDQETNRDTTGLITWANEQAMREIYFLPFEMTVKEGGTTAFMSAFNRMGTVWAGGDYRLLTSLLRNEWGFRGMVITDFNLTPYMNVDQMIRAGGDLNLSPSKNLSDTTSSTGVTAIRKSTKNILYTVVNSNAMNGLGEGVVYVYAMPIWMIWLIVVDIAVIGVLATWGFVVIKKAKKKKGEEII